MLSGKKILSALVGAAMLSMPTGVLAGYYGGGAKPDATYQKAGLDGYRAAHPAPLQLVDDDDWHHHDHDRDWWRHHHRPFNDNDYNWGGRYRYDHPYSYYYSPTPPPQWGKWNRGERESYLVQRRNGAIRLQRQMLARGDRDAANRLGAAIEQLNRRISRGTW